MSCAAVLKPSLKAAVSRLNIVNSCSAAFILSSIWSRPFRISSSVAPAARAEGGPIAVWIANEPFVAGVVGNRFGDEGAAFLSGRTQPNKAKFILRGRIHETRSSVLSRDAESVSPPPMISSTPHTSRNLPLFTLQLLVSLPVPFRAASGVAGSLQHSPLTPVRDTPDRNRRK